MHVLDELLHFPDPNTADDYGLLAIGGDLSKERLLLAYKSGIFPWFEQGQPILWYSPDPRMVLFFEDLKISKSMKQLLKKRDFKVTINTAFKEVITKCATKKRKDQSGTWITESMITAYEQLHQSSNALSIEVWSENQLVGGLYGVDLKDQKIFCGESMFTEKSNASKIAFIYMVHYFKEKKYKLIDCQMHNEHLESLGATEIYRSDFLQILNA